jgi:hypothetical protein
MINAFQLTRTAKLAWRFPKHAKENPLWRIWRFAVLSVFQRIVKSADWLLASVPDLCEAWGMDLALRV